MQVTIPNYQRPFYVEIDLPDDLSAEVNIAEILHAHGFATSKTQAKRMIANGEVWHLPVEIYQPNASIEIRRNMEKCEQIITYGWNLDVLFVGGSKDAAMCHRLVFREKKRPTAKPRGIIQKIKRFINKLCANTKKAITSVIQPYFTARSAISS